MCSTQLIETIDFCCQLIIKPDIMSFDMLFLLLVSKKKKKDGRDIEQVIGQHRIKKE